MVPFLTTEDRGVELPKDGTAIGDECAICGRRFTKMYIIVGRRQCVECTARSHYEAAKAERI